MRPLKTQDPRRKTSPRPRAFTLLETSLATLIVGLTVLSIVKLVTAVTGQNFYAQKTTTAMMLANNLRELFASLPFNDPINGTHLGPNSGETSLALYDDVEDFNGFSANPPIDANRQPIPALSNWQQSVTVTHVNPNNFQLTDTIANDAACVLDRIVVTVSYNPDPTDAAGWTPISSIEFLKSKY
jgi:type II secretory pathway pseudopilin PulG